MEKLRAMQPSPSQKAQEIVKKLGGKWHRSYGMARCPAHNDRTPSLSIRAGDHAVIFHCFAGCTSDAVKNALAGGKIDYHATAANRPVPAPTSNLGTLAREIWANARHLPHTPALKYLRLRGINTVSPGRYDPAAVTYECGDKLTLPALILPIEDSRGVTAIQRIFLDRDTGMKTARLDGAKRTLGNPDGGAIRIGAVPDDILHLAEGLEDACSAMLINKLPHCWAACGVERYGQIEIPASVRKVIIWSQHGKEAADAIKRAKLRLTENDRALEIYLPPPGGDWNDLLTGKTLPSVGPEDLRPLQRVVETRTGKIWINQNPINGSIRVWWPTNSRVASTAIPILKNASGRWNPSQKAWFVGKAKAHEVEAQLIIL